LDEISTLILAGQRTGSRSGLMKQTEISPVGYSKKGAGKFAGDALLRCRCSQLSFRAAGRFRNGASGVVLGLCHLTILILNELAHQVPPQINVQRPWHISSSFLAAPSGGRNHLDFDAQRVQNGEHFAKLARGLISVVASRPVPGMTGDGGEKAI